MPHPKSTLFPYTTLFRSWGSKPKGKEEKVFKPTVLKPGDQVLYEKNGTTPVDLDGEELVLVRESDVLGDRKSTRLNSSHRCISYAVFCLKKKKKNNQNQC